MDGEENVGKASHEGTQRDGAVTEVHQQQYNLPALSSVVAV